MSEKYVVTIKPDEQYFCSILEICKPRSPGDRETHRVMLTRGGIVRVREDQVRHYLSKAAGGQP